MLFHVQNYDVTINYHPGKEMLEADSLSNCASPDIPETPLDIVINHVHITQQKKTKFQAAIHDDPFLYFFTDTILAGWPKDINDVSSTHTMLTVMS